MNHGRETTPGQGKPQHDLRARFFAAPAEFEGCFTTFYQLKLDIADGGTVEDYLQPEWANLRFFSGSLPVTRMPGASAVRDAAFTATGPSTLPAHFELGTCRMWGIGLLPLGWSRLIDASARDCANLVCDGSKHPAFEKFAPLCEVLCDDSVDEEEQRSAIIEHMHALMRPCRDEEKVIAIHRELVDANLTSVAEFSERVGLSIRTLERVCHRYFGFAPKLLMRRQRFMRTLAEFFLGQGKKWTEVMDQNYHDQAQFTREFNEFMTMNPTQYAALEHPVLSAFMEERKRVWGSAAQTLDKPG